MPKGALGGEAHDRQVQLRPFICDARGHLPSITLPSRQLPGLLCFGAGFFSLIVPFDFSLASFLGATLMVDSSSLATEAVRDDINGRTPDWEQAHQL
jgi:hypothetical protein